MIVLVVPSVCVSLLSALWFQRSIRRTTGTPSTPVASVLLLRRMLADKRVGRGTKTILVLPVCYVLSPIQVIPSFIPVLGQLDDVLVVVVCLRIAVHRVPPQLLRELWPGEPAALDRLARLRPSPTAEAEIAAAEETGT
ncbi:MAG: YkvA family protein [Frankiaceae bacterium]